MSKMNAKLVSNIAKTGTDRGFDAEWYLASYAPEITPYDHYMEIGNQEGFEPNPLFNTAYYRLQAEKIGVTVTDPALSHYFSVGADRGLDPHPLFQASYYKSAYRLEHLGNAEAYLHFLTEGAAELQNGSPLFDAKWYQDTYLKGVANAPAPIFHYMTQKAPARFNPCPLFDIVWYNSLYGSTVTPGYDALSYYVVFGASAGQMPNPLFDSHFYLHQYAEVQTAGLNPLADYIARGAREGRFPMVLFDSAWYLNTYSDVRNSSQNPLAHYLLYGAKERRDPSPLFKTAFYLNQTPDSHKISNALMDYVWRGCILGLNPHPAFDSQAYVRKNRLVNVNPLNHYIENFSTVDWPVADAPAKQTQTTTAANRPGWFNTDPSNPLKTLTTSKGYYPDGWCRASCRLEFLSSLPAKRITFTLYTPEHFPPQDVVIRSGNNAPLRTTIQPATGVQVSVFIAELQDGVAHVSLEFGHEYQLSHEDVRLAAAVIDNIDVVTVPSPRDPQSYVITGYETEPSVENDFSQALRGTGALKDMFFAISQLASKGPKGAIKLYLDLRVMRRDFDSEFYAQQLKADNETLQGLHHFAKRGYIQGLDPNASFSTSAYLATYPDVKASGLNPFVHYLKIGRHEGRETKPSLRK